MRAMCLVVCAAVMLAVAPARGAVSFDTLLPEGTVFYVSVRDVPDLLKKLKETEGYKAFKELGLFERVAGPDEFKKMQDFYGRFIDPLGEIFSGEVAFAITSTEEIDDAPRIVLLADVSEGEAALKKYLEGTIYPLLKEEGAEPEKLTRGGVTYTKLLPDPEDPDEPLIFAVRDGVLMAAIRPEVLEGVIKPGPKTLRASAGYADVRRALRGADVQIYFDAGVFIRKALKEGDEEAAAWMEVFGVDKLRAVGLGLGVGPTGGTMTLRVGTEGAPAGFLGAFVRGGGPIKSIKYVPEDAGLYYVLNFDSLLGLYKEFAAGLKAVSDELDLFAYEEFTDGVENLEALLGMELEKDVLAGFGGEIALSAKIPEALGIPPAALMIEVKDKATVEKLVARVMELLEAFAEELETTTATHKGVEITTVLASPQLTPGVAVLDDFLVVATHPGVIRDMLDTAAEGTNIGTSKDYLAAMAGLPTEGAAMMYLDVKALFEFLFPLVAVKAPRHGPAAGGLIKELGSLGEHLSGFGVVLTGDESGLTYRTHSPKAVLQPGLALGAGMMLPALQRAREAARSAASISNVHQLTVAIHMYANENDDELPAKLSDLVAPVVYVDNVGVFVHPKNKAKAKLMDRDKPETVDAHADYELVLKGSLADVKDPATTVMIREKRVFTKGRRVAGYADGHVKAEIADGASEDEDDGDKEGAGEGE